MGRFKKIVIAMGCISVILIGIMSGFLTEKSTSIITEGCFESFCIGKDVRTVIDSLNQPSKEALLVMVDETSKFVSFSEFLKYESLHEYTAISFECGNFLFPKRCGLHFSQENITQISVESRGILNIET